MPKGETIKDLYSEIRKCLFYMIPEKWESIYLYASVIQRDNGEETGEMFFYYFPKSIIKRNPINVYQIPQKFNLNEEEYIKLTDELYGYIKKLRHECQKYDKINWTNITISIENVEFLAEYNCEDLINSIYSNEDRMAIWQYKYLEYPIEKFTKSQREQIEAYLKEEENGLHQSKMYTETFYQQHEHNSIEYDVNKKVDEYIKEDNETTDFTMVDSEQYQIQSGGFFKRRKNRLLNEIKNGNKEAREEFINGNLKLVLSVIKRFYGRGENLDDLFQIGCVGLMKAIENFDSSFNCLFSTYAVPLILGEVKRYIRDSNTIRVTRSIRDLAYKIMKYKDLYQSIHGVEPKNEDILMELGITEYELKEAYDSLREPMSIYDPIYNDGGDTIYLLDQLKDEKYDNIDKDLIISLNRALKYIKTREKNILISRYIVGKTQMELASELGVSQAQISRIEKNAINNVKKYIK